MTITTGQLTVGTTPVQIDGTSTSNYKLHIHNADNQANLYLGNATVSASTGLILPKQDSTELNLYPGETIWVVSDTTNHLVSWLKQV
jgi:FtsP/CotA-like multicopper oxidase with cupredoxin domain